MPFFVIKKGLVLLEWKYFPTPKILDPLKRSSKIALNTQPLSEIFLAIYQYPSSYPYDKNNYVSIYS